MLVLSRKQLESILIGEEITVMVISIRGENVKLGITAPRSTAVMRAEIIPTDPSTKGGRDAT